MHERWLDTETQFTKGEKGPMRRPETLRPGYSFISSGLADSRTSRLLNLEPMCMHAHTTDGYFAMRPAVMALCLSFGTNASKEPVS